MNSSIINGLIRDWGTDPIFILAVTAIPMLWLALCSRRRKPRQKPNGWHSHPVWSRLFALLWLSWLLLSTAPASVNPLVEAWEKKVPFDSSCAPDSPIVLLGGGINEVEFLYRASHVRAAFAARLATTFEQAPIVAAGGGLADIPEAAMMRQYLVFRGLDEARIFTDDRSINTRENALNVASLVVEKNWSNEVRLVTSAIHMPRAIGVFQAVGLTPCALPTDYQALSNVPWYMLAPQTTALEKFDDYLHERIGTWVYKRRGWLADSK